jgi:hypothetical protein
MPNHYYWTNEAIIDLIRKAFDAGSAYAIGDHKDFTQTHPDRETYIANLLKDKQAPRNEIHQVTSSDDDIPF